ncbi:MAG TPA: DUF3108 domain-containing protein [Edaphocola sp.]|nr:DUF3108 domain-containing protein [Edaphocola sp.]
MMNVRLKKVTGLLLTCLFVWGTAPAQNSFCNLQNKCIHEGEKINFKVYYNVSFVWVPAGEANFTTRKATLSGRDVFHIIGDGATYSSYDWFFKVRDKYQTWIDAQTLLPLRFERKVHEGDYKYHNVVSFNQDERFAESRNKRYQMPECVQDVLSSIFYARNIDYSQYKPGDKIPFSMFLDDQVYNIYIRYLGKETITTKYGTFRALKIAPLLIKGTLFEGGEKMLVWVSDDKNHLPLRVSSPILVGSIKADMMGYKNLKYPLSALVSRK